MESLSLFHSKKEWSYFFILTLITLFLSLFFVKYNYSLFIKDEVYKVNTSILNIYKKDSYDVLKLKTNNFEFFTSINKNHGFKKEDHIQAYIITKNITFYNFLKGFYAKTINLQKIPYKNLSLKSNLSNYIDMQHESKVISSLYKALFLAIPIDPDLRDFFANLSITHLIAISGFHLTILSFVLYFIFNFIYSPIHQKYFPYRNKRFDIMITVSTGLFFYMILTNMPPSLLRAFVMFIFAFFLLRFNIKLLSFETLFIVVAIIIALFPKLLFSLAFWFSVCGVFYIFLYIHYFKDINKCLHIFLFNFWIFFAMNPISHYFFANSSIEQLLSPFITLVFTVFYPLSLLLHIINQGDLLDNILLYFISIDINSTDILTPFWFFILFICFSFLSIFYKKAFYFLNILLIVFNLYLYL